MSREHRVHANLLIVPRVGINNRFYDWVGDHSHVCHHGIYSSGKCLLRLIQFREEKAAITVLTDPSWR